MSDAKPGPSFRLIEHTGDIGFEVDGESPSALFVHAAHALSSLITDTSRVEERIHREVEAEGDDAGELLVAFLGEILYMHDTEDLLFCRTEIRSGPIPGVAATVFGEGYDPERHTILRQVKAVTYHGLEVRQSRGIWQARVILDI